MAQGHISLSIWDVLKSAHEGDEVTKITKRETIEGELGRFVLNQGEEWEHLEGGGWIGDPVKFNTKYQQPWLKI